MEQVEIFINEKSFDFDAFCDPTEKIFVQNLASFLDLIKGLEEKKSKHKKDIRVFVKNEQELMELLKDIQEHSGREKQYNSTICRILFEKINTQKWENEKEQLGELTYTYISVIDDAFENMNQTSIAEAAERKFSLERNVLLLNFKDTMYGKNKYIEVLRCEQRENELIKLNFLENADDFLNWIKLIESFDELLKDIDRFERTNIRVKGACVYKDKKKGYYWHVDTFHYDITHKEEKRPVEMEVYDNDGIHIGTANMKGDLNRDNRDPARTINIK